MTGGSLTPRQVHNTHIGTAKATKKMRGGEKVEEVGPLVAARRRRGESRGRWPRRPDAFEGSRAEDTCIARWPM